MAGRIIDEAGADRDRQIQAGFRLAYSRAPDGWEKDTVLTFLETQRRIIADRAEAGERLLLPDSSRVDEMSPAEAAAVVDFSHMLAEFERIRVSELRPLRIEMREERVSPSAVRSRRAFLSQACGGRLGRLRWLPLTPTAPSALPILWLLATRTTGPPRSR